MKKNILFSLALCVGLLLPTASFGSEPQSWRQYFSSYIPNMSGYMPQLDLSQRISNFINRLSNNGKYLVYAAAATALGIAYLSYSQYIASKQKKSTVDSEQILSAVEEPNIDPGQKKLDNIALFLSAVEHNDFSIIKISNNPDPNEIFKNYICPTLKKLKLPEEPSRTSEQASYRAVLKKFWTQYIEQIKNNQRNIQLEQDTIFYLEILKRYLDNCPENESLRTSLDEAIFYMKEGLPLSQWSTEEIKTAREEQKKALKQQQEEKILEQRSGNRTEKRKAKIEERKKAEAEEIRNRPL